MQRAKMKQTVKAILTGTVILSMVLADTTQVTAKKITKQESVYVNVAANGEVSQVIVSDWLQNSAGTNGKITDASDLKDIKNIKGDETFSQQGNEIKWDASDKDIYYQGSSEKALPVSLNITYRLDGEEISAKDLAGKSGKVEMHVTYVNNSKRKKNVNGKEVELYTPFVMVTGMILDNEIFSNVEIDHGRVINEGSNCIVVGVGLPGFAESMNINKKDLKHISSDFTMTADAKDFQLENTYTYGSPSLMEAIDLENIDSIDELDEKVGELTDAAGELVKGTKTLSTNMSKFSDKMGELKTSVKTFKKSGVKKLSDGINTLAKNGPKLKKGINDYAGGVIDFANGTTDYVNGATKIFDGNIALYKAVSDLPGKITTFDKGVKTYTNGVDKLGTEENVTKIKNGAGQVTAGIKQINDVLAQLEESYAANEQMMDALAPIVATNPSAKAVFDKLQETTAVQKTTIAQLKAATAADSDLRAGATVLAGGVGQVMDGLLLLSGSSSQLTKGSNELNTSMPELVKNVKALKDGSEKLKSNNGKLIKGGKDLKTASKKMKKTAASLSKGMQKLQKGGKSLLNATSKLENGVGKLQSASVRLENGAKTISKGTNKFNKDGIKKLADTYENDIKDMIERFKAVIHMGKEYDSFSGIGSDMNGEVKFIIETDAIKNE